MNSFIQTKAARLLQTFPRFSYLYLFVGGWISGEDLYTEGSEQEYEEYGEYEDTAAAHEDLRLSAAGARQQQLPSNSCGAGSNSSNGGRKKKIRTHRELQELVS